MGRVVRGLLRRVINLVMFVGGIINLAIKLGPYMVNLAMFVGGIINLVIRSEHCVVRQVVA